MKKLLLTIALGVSLGHSYAYLTLLDCKLEIGGYVGLYKSMSGQYYTMKFQNYCPYSYTIK